MVRNHFLREPNQHGNISRHATHYSIFQSQFKQEADPENSQDLYRTTYDADPIRDASVDDEYLHHGDAFDSFDQKLLLQPYDDRQRQAAQGRARLSLASNRPKFLDGLAFSQPQRATSTHEQELYDTSGMSVTTAESDELDDGITAYPDLNEISFYGRLGRFAYNDSQVRDSSSDVQVGPSSSPALRAGQRRTENNVSAVFGGESGKQSGFHHVLEQPDFEYPNGQIISCPVNTHEIENHVPMFQQTERAQPSHAYNVSKEPPKKFQSSMNATPVIQGIQLVPITTLPDRLRTIFPFPFFNAVQSKCFDKVFRSDNNFVLASPTGSGKTAILELAVCRTLSVNASGQYKIVYQAPTKALCSERQRDWEAKFSSVGLKCAELTGDSDAANLRNVQSANIIITTSEKWDSITRRWKDHERLMGMIKLFLIDEVHILKEDRGAVLEAVVSRMKSINTAVRFLALSATVPNFRDVAAWLGKSASEPHESATYETFGEEFRPVKLQKHVCGYTYSSSNDFAFETVLDSKLPEVISRYSERKPIMIFCATRNSTVNTARLITKWWAAMPNGNRAWDGPSKALSVRNKDLQGMLASGVAFHHAGLDSDERMLIEKAFLSGEVSVICCTSTLAVGVNLPCHLVIVKNTVAFTANGLQEYSDLEMMQMLGRAGRPQFEDSAVAVIMTRQSKVDRYEKMVSGQELLESRLHLNLIDHVNAEIGLGTIRDLGSARKWLTGTFLYIRLQQNPGHYKLDSATGGQTFEEQVDDICFRDINLLRENNLVSGQDYFRSTEFGKAMAQYYVHFETMKMFMGIPSRLSPSEMLSAIAQATEFSSIRFRQGEKLFYKTLNKSPSIRWAIPVNLDLPAQKVSLIIQSILGSADISWNGEMGKHRNQYLMEAQMIFKNASSLIRCIIDCQVCLGDSISIHSALLLERSLGSQAWDDSPLQMKQIEAIGVVAVRKFVNAGIRSMDDLEACEPHRIETLIGRNPPFGLQVLEKVKLFPKLRVSLHVQPSSIIKVHDGVKIQIKAEIGFINDKVPQFFRKKPVYVCLLVETSDGRKAHFARISGSKLGLEHSLGVPVLLTSSDQSINGYVMCDGIAGSMRSASVKPQIASAMFPTPEPAEPDVPRQSNVSKRRIEDPGARRKRSTTSEDFDGGINDEELVQASFSHLQFEDIDDYLDHPNTTNRQKPAKNISSKSKQQVKTASNSRTMNATTTGDGDEAVQLANGKWACNHRCKDRSSCKHLCCKEGTDKPPKKKTNATKSVQSQEDSIRQTQEQSGRKGKSTQTKLQLTTIKRKRSASIEHLDLTQEKKKKTQHGSKQPKDLRGLQQLHKQVQGNIVPSSLQSVTHTKPVYCYSQGGDHSLSFMGQQAAAPSQGSSEYGDFQYDDAFSNGVSSQQNAYLAQTHQPAREPYKIEDTSYEARTASQGSDMFGDDDSLLRDAMIGLMDSQNLQAMMQEDCNVTKDFEHAHEAEDETNFHLNEFCMDMDMDIALQAMDVAIPTQNLVGLSLDTSATKLPMPASTKSKPPPIESRPLRTTSNTSNLGRFQQSGHAPLTIRLKTAEKSGENKKIARFNSLDDPENQLPTKTTAEEKPIPKAFQDLEPWIFQEFGDIVELVDE